MSSSAKWIAIVAVLAGARTSGADALGAAPLALGTHRPVGVGASRTMAGATGLEVVYWPDRLGVTATATASRAEVESFGGFAQTATAGSLVLTGFVTLTGSEHARLALGLQLGVGRMTSSIGPDQTNYQAGLPLRCEVFLTNQLSLHADFGFTVMSSQTRGGPTSTVLQSSGSVIGIGGFTYYL